jgi:2-polyprenyl-3-methyl-5-hydroxy-6-metoxy-1,4-benzoquinol methylase
MHAISNIQIYLDRMAKPLAEKLKIAHYVPEHVDTILDVGCADGVVSAALADMFPNAQVVGIDLNEEFIKRAKEQWGDKKNLRFECVYLRELLARPARYDVVVFCSVLHEFYSYGEGISSVLKALSDAHEVLRPGGRLLIRDMILRGYTKEANLYCLSITEKIKAKEESHFIKDFEEQFGKLDTLYTLNHYLLKYWYKENWERESKEHYTPVTFEQYEAIFSLLGMKEQINHSYTIPFLEQKWKDDFNLTEDELSTLRSTGILVAEKV